MLSFGSIFKPSFIEWFNYAFVLTFSSVALSPLVCFRSIFASIVCYRLNLLVLPSIFLVYEFERLSEIGGSLSVLVQLMFLNLILVMVFSPCSLYMSWSIWSTCIQAYQSSAPKPLAPFSLFSLREYIIYFALSTSKFLMIGIWTDPSCLLGWSQLYMLSVLLKSSDSFYSSIYLIAFLHYF